MMGDPDRDFLAVIAAEEVPIGADVELPRTPTVFEEKTKWPLEPEEADTAGLLWAVWHLLYADDGLAIARGGKCRESCLLMWF